MEKLIERAIYSEDPEELLFLVKKGDAEIRSYVAENPHIDKAANEELMKYELDDAIIYALMSNESIDFYVNRDLIKKYESFDTKILCCLNDSAGIMTIKDLANKEQCSKIKMAISESINVSAEIVLDLLDDRVCEVANRAALGFHVGEAAILKIVEKSDPDLLVRLVKNPYIEEKTKYRYIKKISKDYIETLIENYKNEEMMELAWEVEKFQVRKQIINKARRDKSVTEIFAADMDIDIMKVENRRKHFYEIDDLLVITRGKLYRKEAYKKWSDALYKAKCEYKEHMRKVEEERYKKLSIDTILTDSKAEGFKEKIAEINEQLERGYISVELKKMVLNSDLSPTALRSIYNGLEAYIDFDYEPIEKEFINKVTKKPINSEYLGLYFKFLVLLAVNKNLPEDVAIKIAEKDPESYIDMSKRVYFPESEMRKLLALVKLKLISNPNLSARVIEILSYNARPAMKMEIAGHPNTSNLLLYTLCFDLDVDIALEAAVNPSLKEEIREKVYKNSDISRKIKYAIEDHWDRIGRKID